MEMKLGLRVLYILFFLIPHKDFWMDSGAIVAVLMVDIHYMRAQ